MKMTISVVLGAALLAIAFSRASVKVKGGSRQDLKWWQASIVLVAVIVAMLIVLTPEFFALGLIGDTAFFDLLVLLVGLQLQGVTAQAQCWLAGSLSKAISWLTFPRMSYLLVLSVWAAITDLVSSIAAVWHRIAS